MKLTEFNKITSILAKKYKINIKEGKSWAAELKSKTVFYVKEDIYALKENNILGLTLHETAHIQYTTETEPEKKEPELHHTTLNMVEDISIENIISKDYPNASNILKETNKDMVNTLIKILPKLTISQHEKALLHAAISFQKKTYKQNKEKYEQVGNEILKEMNKNKKLILNRKKTKELLPLTRVIVEILLKHFGKTTQENREKMKIKLLSEKDGKNINEIKQKITKELKKGTRWEKSSINTDSSINFIDEIVDQTKEIGRKLRAVMKNNNSMEFGGKFRTGKLKPKRLVRIKIQKDRNPFMRKIVKSNKNYTIAIGVDISGSMKGHNEKNKISYAMSSCFMVKEALEMASVQSCIVLFGENAILVKNIKKKKLLWEELISCEFLRKANENSTNIDKAISLCTKELSKINTERKIMIILTDGNSEKGKIEIEYEKAKKQNIECLGITILDPSEKNDTLHEVFGEKNVTKIEDTSNTEKIGKAFIEILKKNIKKGSRL
jgi:hypothetical protein